MVAFTGVAATGSIVPSSDSVFVIVPFSGRTVICPYCAPGSSASPSGLLAEGKNANFTNATAITTHARTLMIESTNALLDRPAIYPP